MNSLVLGLSMLMLVSGGVAGLIISGALYLKGSRDIEEYAYLAGFGIAMAVAVTLLLIVALRWYDPAVWA